MAEDRYVELGDQLRGKPNPLTKGIYELQRIQKFAREHAVAQQDFHKPDLANTYSETVLALKRQQALLNRKQELEKVGVVTNP
jgi:hypothetical protein